MRFGGTGRSSSRRPDDLSTSTSELVLLPPLNKDTNPHRSPLAIRQRHVRSLSPLSLKLGLTGRECRSNTNVTLKSLCRLQFTLPSTLQPPVFMYYKLTNYYQNHRRYVKSLSTEQLQGKATVASKLDSDNVCKPIARSAANQDIPIYPCGLIANSYYNDSYQAPVLISTDTTGLINPNLNQIYNMSEKGIAWPGEASKYKATAYTPEQCAPPPFWALRYPNGYTADGPTAIPDFAQDEHFQVWMRTAGLPTFRKLYFRCVRLGTTSVSCEDEALSRFLDPQAGYGSDASRDISHPDLHECAPSSHGASSSLARLMSIWCLRTDYPVKQYKGTKSIVFSTVSFIGGRNPFLGIAYIVVGGLAFALGLALTIRHVVKPRRLGDMSRLTYVLPFSVLGFSWRDVSDELASLRADGTRRISRSDNGRGVSGPLVVTSLVLLL